MNEILASDTACSQRRLKIATYKVIPMTSRVGILEWVLNTKTLKEVVEEEIAKDEV